MSIELTKLSRDTLRTIAPTALVGMTPKEIGDKKSDITRLLRDETESAGIKELAFMLSNIELSDICDNYLHVEYKEGQNRKNKMVLTKRLMESFLDSNIDNWFKRCDNKDVLKTIGGAMDIPYSSKTPLNEYKESLKHQICLFGETVVLHRLTVPQLRILCEDIGVEGSDNTSSKRILIEAITTRTNIAAKTSKPKKTKVTKKKPIGKASEYLELFQHYKVSELEDWCKENGVKTSGPKKALCQRIVAFNGGDKENTMATESDNKPKRGAPKKEAASKKTKKTEPEPESESESEPEPESENMDEASAEEASGSESEEQVQEPEKEPEPEPEQEDESETEMKTDDDIEISQSQDVEVPCIEGKTFCIAGKNFKNSKKLLVAAITKGKGVFTTKLTSSIDYLICDPESTDKAVVLAKKKGIACESEDFLAPFL